MKRIDESPYVELRQINVYRDDLVYIEDVLKELKAKKITIQLGEFEYDSVDEIPVSEKMSHKIRIATSQPYVNVTLDRYYANISSLDNTLEIQGAIKKISERLNKRVRRFRHYFTVVGVSLGTFVFAIAFVALLADKIPDQFKNVAALAVIPSMILVGILSIIRFRHYSTIHFEAQRGNFFTRNKDQIIVAVISALVGVIATSVITALF